MKITNVSVDVFGWEVEPWRVGSGMRFGGPRSMGVVTVETDAGISGNAFLSRPEHHAQALIDVAAPRVLGCNPQDIGSIWADLWKQNRAMSTAVIGAIDICLWDINGKIAGQPISPAAGDVQDVRAGLFEHRVVGDAAGVRGGGAALPGRRLAGAQDSPACRAQDGHRDLPRAVREAVGDEMILMLDSMWSYGYEDAVRVGRAIEELDYYWYEDPLVEEDIYSYVKLHQKLDIPIMSTEYAPGRYYGMTQWITQYATDILRGDVAVTGGITPLVRLCHLAEGFKMKCEIHHGGNSLNNVANLHVTMAVPNCEFFEYFPSTGSNMFGLVEDIDMSGGVVHAPTGVGLGYEIDWDLLRRDERGRLEVGAS